MTRAKPWLKMWTEWVDDPKMLRLSLAEQGAWWRLVALAQKCNAEGKLVTSSASSLSLQEITDSIHIKSEDMPTFNSMLEKMTKESSLYWNDSHTLTITHFHERQEQAASDTPEALRERQRRRRQKLWETYGIKDSTIPVETRRFVIDRDECRCQLCNKQGILPSPDAAIVLDPEDNSPFEFDHLIPRAQGGLDTPENLRLACRKCNRARRNLSAREETPPQTPPITDIEEEGEGEGEEARVRDKSVTKLPKAEAKTALSRNISDKPTDQIYGEGRNIRLSGEEVANLEARFGKQGTQDRIEALSLYKGSTGKKYASDYLTILNWDRMAKKKGKYPGKPPPGTIATSKELDEWEK